MVTRMYLLCLLAPLPVLAAVPAQDPKVFDSEPATFTPEVFARSTGVLRTITIDERVGEARSGELVRVPLFFHANECADPNALVLAPLAGGDAIPYQADDIRRDASGNVARMTVYFPADLEPWARKQFTLKAGKNPAAPAMTATQDAQTLVFAGDDLTVTFRADAERAGVLTSIKSKAGAVTFGEGAAPSATLFRQGGDLGAIRETPVAIGEKSTQIRNIRWAAGPHFAKLVIKAGPAEFKDEVAYEYIVPRRGNVITQTQKFYPLEKDTPETVGAKNNLILKGPAKLAGADANLVEIPAGLRLRTRNVFANKHSALVNEGAKLSLLLIPNSVGGWKTIEKNEDGTVSFRGPTDFQTKQGSNSGSLRVFWGQSRFVVSSETDTEGLWRLGRRNSQPLVAIVDEPGANDQEFSKAVAATNEKFFQIKNWNPAGEARMAMSFMRGQKEAAEKIMAPGAPAQKTGGVEGYIPTVEAVEAAWKKFQGAGGLDPYGITYSRSGMFVCSALAIPSERVDYDTARLAEASRLTNGRVNGHGSPHLRSFANAANMQMGTLLAGIYAGRKTENNDLLHWSYAAAENQAYYGIYGHAQRPYTINIGDKGASDQLYMSITDFFFRAIELCAQEDMELHPAVYARYTDCIDVNADIYQRKILKEGGSSPTWDRAMMFRGQAHDHRWEGYGCDAFLAMLDPRGSNVGLTEAIYYMDHQSQRPMSWNRVMTDAFLPWILRTKGVAQYKPTARLPLPANVKTVVQNGRALVTWTSVRGAAGYRIYRAENVGGPWDWVNSPYKKMEPFVLPTSAQRRPTATSPATQPWTFKIPAIPDTLVKTTSFEDATGNEKHIYFITAEDPSGRESKWFSEEPLGTRP